MTSVRGNIAADFLRTAARKPEAPCLVGTDDQAMSYAAVRHRARQVAAALGRAGTRPGDRVLLTHPNGTELVCAYLGALLHGCVVANVDHRAQRPHLDFVRHDTAAVAWLAPADHPAADADLVPVDTGGTPAPPAWLEGDACDAPEDALIMYTSGTTGVPKGVRLTHANLRHTAASITTWAGVRADEVELTTLSLSHLFGLGHVHVHWTLGGTVVIEPGLQDIPRVLRRMVEHSVTSFPGTPAGFRRFLDDWPEEFQTAAANLRYIVVNSAPMPEGDARRLLDLIPHVRIYMYYGLTEASRSTVIHYNAHPHKLSTVGRPTPGTDIRVAVADDPSAKPAPTGDTGEILVRGPHVSPAYWGSNASAAHRGDGWFRTGDLGVLDADGFLTWTGRLKEQINVDGLKVAPTEVESVLRLHPEVVDCAVAGVADHLTGQAVVAFVVASGEVVTPLALELRRWCRPRLEPHKIPRRIEFVDEIPRTDTGKVRRGVLVGNGG